MADNKPTVSESDAITTAEKYFNATYDKSNVTLEYLVLEDGQAALVRGVNVDSEDGKTSVKAYVDAHNNTIHTFANYVTPATVGMFAHNIVVPRSS